MLVVPFGRRRLLGVVVDVADESELPPERLAEPIAALEADVPQSLVALGLWVAREYVSTPARGLALVLPPGTGHRRGPAAAPEALAAGGDHPGRRGGARRGRADGRAPARRRWRRSRARRWERPRSRGAPGARTRRCAASSGAACCGSRARPTRCAARGCTGSARAPAAVGSRADQAAAFAVIEGRLDSSPAVARAPPAAPARGHRQRQDRGLPARRGRRARARPLGDRAGAGDRADAADGRPLRRALRRAGGGDALAALAAGALRRVVADAPRRGARLRRAALGRVRAVRRPRADHRRRGARRLVQAGGRSPLRRSRGRGAPRGRRGRAAGGRERHAAAGEHAAPRADRAARRAWTGGGCRRWSSWGWRARPGRCTSAPARRSTRCAAAGEKAIVLLNRRGWSNFLSCRSCARVWECPNCDVTLVLHRERDEVACHHCGHRELAPRECPDCELGVGGPPRGRHRAARARARGAGGAAAGVPARLGRGRGGGRRHRAAALRRGAGGRARRHPDGGEGPRLPGRHARRRARRRRHASLPGLPRRGAHLRAGGPARRPQRPRRARRARDRAGARPVRRGAPLRRAPRRGRLPRGGAAAPRAARLPAPRPPDPGGLLVGRAGAGAGRRHGDPRAHRRRRACRRSGRRRCSAARRATARSSWSAHPSERPRSPPCARRSSAWPRSASTPRRASRWTWIRSKTRRRSPPLALHSAPMAEEPENT